MTKDKLGNPLQINDVVQIDATYGGGIWQIIEMSPSSSFIVVINKNKQRKSVHGSDVKKIMKQQFYFD